MTIRAIIVDDEELARRGIRSLLARSSDIEVVAECSNAREAIQAIKAQAPDLVFLDVQMPGRSGFEVIEAADPDRCPYFVFITAFDDFAVRAFDVHALDYLLKPINEQRFELALERVRTALSGSREDLPGRRLTQWPADTDNTGEGDRIAVKADGKVIVIRISEVDWVKAEHDHVSLHIGTKAWLMRETIGAIEARFAGAGFVRIHRSTLVNVDRVEELRPLDKGEFQIVLRDGVQLKLSRNYRIALPRLTGAAL
jgi:two-component system, LytTR family, response regulator